MILRLYGRGSVIAKDNEEWPKLYSLFDPFPEARQIIALEIDSVQTSCGDYVPKYQFQGERKSLRQWVKKKWEGV